MGRFECFDCGKVWWGMPSWWCDECRKKRFNKKKKIEVDSEPTESEDTE